MSRRVSVRYLGLFASGVIALAGVAAPAFGDDSSSILSRLKNINVITSTVPANGDINPYGIIEVKHSIGNLQRGHVLISNFNNMANQQGTGTTIMDVAGSNTLNSLD